MQPFYFGRKESSLYGVVHEPRGGPFRSSAILICQPVAHEYFRTHRMVVLLAEKLAANGYYVMRFDYYGMGDSYGKFQEVSVPRWIEDIECASEEIKLISGCESVSVIGIRLGGTLVCQPQLVQRWSMLILWDPVTTASQYIRRVNQLTQETLNSFYWHARSRKAHELSKHEYLGYCYSSELVNQLNDLVVKSDQFPAYADLHWFETEHSTEVDALVERIRKNGVSLKQTDTDDMGDWYHLYKVTQSITTSTIIAGIEKVLE